MNSAGVAAANNASRCCSSRVTRAKVPTRTKVVVHESARNGQEKDQPRAFSLIVPGNASPAAADRERNLIDQLGACMWESDAIFGQVEPASSS